MPQCDRIAGTRYRIDGVLGDYLASVSEQWLKVAPRANPALLEMFRDRDRRPLREMVMWAGEFAGKYLTGAVQVLRVTGDESLREVVAGFVAELVSLQAANGYLGPWPSPYGLTNRAPNCRQGAPLWDPVRGGDTWDAWGHYHITLGLLLWHADSGDTAALRCASRMADRLCDLYLGTGSPRLVDTGWSKVNLAPAHSLALLYRVTGEARYLQLAEQLVAEFAACDAGGRPLAGNYLDGTLAGLEYFELPNTGWESLHSIMALAELYPLTGNPRYRDALQRIWWSITATDRHNNGGFSSGEMAVGDPYDLGAIETCCTIAWIALSVEMLRLSGDARVADEIELSTLNSVLGLHSASGRWVTYDTPPDGKRIDSGVTLGWQGREGSPELNCCSVNGARGLGMVSDWALMQDAEGLLLNWYGPSEFTVPLRDSVAVTLRQQTRYPVEGYVALSLTPSASAAFRLKLRIPRWSRNTAVAVNGTPVAPVTPGTYLAIERTWHAGDTVEIDLDLSVHCWPGHNARAGTTSLYRGPLLLTYDRRYNEIEPDALPAFDARRLHLEPVTWPHWLAPVTLLECAAADGRKLRLCDFASAGESGTPYRSWLPVANVDGALSQCFAPSRGRRLRAEIGRFAKRYQAHLHSTNIALYRRIDLIRLGSDAAGFLQACDEARELIAVSPDTAEARSLAAALERIAAASDIMEPSLAERIQRQLDELHDAPVCTLSDWRVGELQPAIADIRDAALPPEAEFDRSLSPRGGSLWTGIDAVHRGQAGTVYLRVTATMPRTERARLMYGADGSVKVWLNGRAVDWRLDPSHEESPEEYRTEVDWRQGENTLVFALDTSGGRARRGVHISIPDR